MKLKRILFILLIVFMPFVVNAQESFEITDIHVVEQSGTVTIEDLSYDNNTISSNITFDQVDDFVTLEIEMKNNTSVDYVLSSITNQFNNDNIVIDSDSISKIIKGNDIQQFRITLKYENELVNVRERNLENVALSFNFVDINTLINPKTNNNFLFIVLWLITIIGISFILYKKKKNMLFVSLVLLMLPIYVCAEESINFDINIHFNSLIVKGRMLHYNITVDDENGNVQVLDKEYGQTISDIPVPEKEGYHYDYWVDQNNQEVDDSSIVTNDMTIKPHYTPLVYSIFYDLNGGSITSSNPDSYTIEDDITLNNPTKVGYTFQGWSSDGGETYQTDVHLNGDTGNKSFIAYFSANPDTNYVVIHRQMNIDGNGYTEVEIQTLHGATDTNITPQTNIYEGFTAPEVQTKNINGDGSTTFTYDYVRNQYTFNIADRSYVNSSTTVNGTYYYGTEITLSAKNRAGYSFRWSDGNTSRDRTIIISSNTSLTAVYTANIDTSYTVIHKQMNINGSGYTEVYRQNLTGTTDTSVTPAVNIYEGFTAPETQTVNIDGDGSRVVTYLYKRNKYTLTLEDTEYIQTTFTNGTKYYYDTEITLEAKTINGYTFLKWSNDSTSNPITFNLTGDITMKPIYYAEGLSFASSSWDEIIEAYNSGDIESLEADMNAGTTRDVDMGTFGTHKLRIANLSTPDECNTEGFSQTACGFVLEFADIITQHRINPYSGAVKINGDGNKGSWEYSEMRTYVNSDIYNSLPILLRNVIIDTMVVSGRGPYDSANSITTDKLYLLSLHEVMKDTSSNKYLSNYDKSYDKTRQFDYYAGLNITNTNYTGAIKKLNTSDWFWWLRSGPSSSTECFYGVNNKGSLVNGRTSNYNGVSPAFRIGKIND